jgi:hypothetical protein
VATNIHDEIDRLLRRQVRLRSLCKRNDERLATLYRTLREQDGGQPRYLPEPPVNDVETDDELVEEVRSRMRRVGLVPKLKKK